MTRAPGMSIVLMRPPSLEPSTPDVREPREWTISGGLGYRVAALQGGDNGIDRRLIAQATCVEDHVVVRGVDAVVAVDLADVGGPVLVGLLQPLPRLLFGGYLQPLHDRLDPHRLGRSEEDVQGPGQLT